VKQLLVRSETCVGCKSCELACAVSHSESKTLFGAVLELKRPRKRIFVETDGITNFPLQCRQCSDMPCVHACMAGAMYQEPNTGPIQVNAEKCVGCWMCVMVCPFGAITEGPARQAVKCDRCRDLDYEPACVAACPTKALQWADVDSFAAAGRRSWVTHLKEANNHAE